MRRGHKAQRIALKKKLGALEPLECRAMFHGDDRPWYSPVISVSIAPDGADIAGVPSALAAKLNALAPSAVWQETLKSAFQAWADDANVNFVFRTDDGSPFGVAGSRQGDSRFGDVRVGGRPLDSSVYAISGPSDALVSGTWGGDLLFNTDANFTSLNDFYGVALHEVGHILGLSHSADPQSVMHAHGIPSQLSLQATDQSAVQSLYGPRAADRSESNDWTEAFEFGQEVKQHAFHLSAVSFGDGLPGTAPSIFHGDISGSGDYDWIRLDSPFGFAGPIQVDLRSDTLSLLDFSSALFDSSGTMLVQAGGPANTQRLTAAASAGDHYYLRVAARDDGLYQSGGYSVAVRYVGLTTPSLEESLAAADGRYRLLDEEEIAEALYQGNAFLVDAEMEIEEGIPQTSLNSEIGAPENSRYSLSSSLASTTDVDRFQIKSPRDAASTWGLSVQTTSAQGSIVPRMRVYDEAGQLLSGVTLLASANDYALQIAGISPNANYIVEVFNPGGAHAAGNYSFVASFHSSVTTQFLLNEQMLRADHVSNRMQFTNATLVQPLLDVKSGAASFEIVNSSGAVIASASAESGSPASSVAVLLLPGEYTIRYHVMAAQGLSRPYVQLFARALTDPFATIPKDPNQPQCPSGAGIICFAGGFWVYVTTLLPGDTDGDGDVDLADFGVLRNQFLSRGDNLAADANGDGVVDFLDFMTLRRNFGTRKN